MDWSTAWLPLLSEDQKDIDFAPVTCKPENVFAQMQKRRQGP